MSPTAKVEERTFEVPSLLPILPLRGIVVFPMAIAPLAVGQARSIRLVDDVMRTHRLLGLVAQKDPEQETAGPDDLYRVGSVATIHQLLRAPDGSLRLIVQGIERIRVEGFANTDPYLVARITVAHEAESPGTEQEALLLTVRGLFERLVPVVPELPEELADAARRIGDPRQLVYFVAANAPLSVGARQELIEKDAVGEQLHRLIDLLQHEIAVRELQQKITSDTAEQMTRAQRSYVLREQIKAIQRELGETGGGGAEEEVTELRRRLEKTALSDEGRKEAEREIGRLAQMAPGSPEYGMVQGYLDWLLSLPWNRPTGAPIDVARARAVLDEDHYDLEKIKERLLDHLAVRKLRRDRERREEGGSEPAGIAAEELAREPILCFVGPPGVGKTSLGQSIARAMGRRFARLSLGGVHDESEIRGHRRTYIGAMPGRVIQALRRADASDPVFMLDEVDKLGAGFQGDPAAALLEVLDPAQNQSFVDTYLGLPFDLSRVLFICTANTIETIPPPLLDRMELLTLSAYTEEEKRHIARRYLLPKQIHVSGLASGEVEVSDGAIRGIVRDYTREAGVRGLERALASVIRKIARRISEGTVPPIRIDRAQLHELLGPPRFHDELTERIDRPGIATGLAWTPSGGEILFVEAALMPGREGLVLTGMMGDVMRESAQAALSFVRSNAERLGFDPRLFEGKIVHVHVPAGAIPKDGPSAGVALMAALASLALGKPIRNDVAMTGEITLRGKILPVGGIKEKVLAAHRAGVQTVILPRANADALEEVPDEARRALHFVLADSAEELLAAALGGAELPVERPPEGPPAVH